MDAPPFTGGWITGRFRGHYEGSARGIVRSESLEIRDVRLVRGALTEARFMPFGPVDPGPSLRQPGLEALWVAVGVDAHGDPRWQQVPVRDVWLCEFVKGDDDLLGATSLGEVSGTLWGRLGGGEEAEVGVVEPVPERVPEGLG